MTPVPVGKETKNASDPARLPILGSMASDLSGTLLGNRTVVSRRRRGNKIAARRPLRSLGFATVCQKQVDTSGL